MDQAAIDRVLACRTLPSLPGLALEVLDLTRDRGAPIEKIAALVQNDPALTTRILRTVNSSFYGLTNPCPTIGRAFSLLGLNTVKSLVLGFSLVEMTGKGERRGFDMVAYWRRVIYAAAGARLFARRLPACDPEEAFVGGLLQDVGMLATHAALGDIYGGVLQAAPEDHEELAPLEHARLGFDHAEIGSLLAERWKLPPQIVECTRHHHRPQSAPPPFQQLLRLVALGSDAAATLTLPAPTERLNRLVSRAQEWLGIGREECGLFLRDIADGASQLSSLLELKTGSTPDVSQILAEASDQLADLQMRVGQEASELQHNNEVLARQVVTDTLTGVANRKHFDTEVEELFTRARSDGTAVSVLFVDADRFKSVNDTHGHRAGDAVLIQLARRLQAAVGTAGTVCRYGGEEFAIALPRCDLNRASSLAEAARKAVESPPIDLRALALPVQEVTVTVSIGVAASETMGLESADELVHAADDALYIAKNAGRNSIRIAAAPPAPSDIRAAAPPASLPIAAPLAPTSPSGPGRQPLILLVEPDPLAAKLIELTLARRPEVRLLTAATAEEALHKFFSGSPEAVPDILLCTLSLPGIHGLGLIRTLRADPAWQSLPIIAMAASDEPHTETACHAAGATRFLTKAQFCSNLARWTSTMVDLATKQKKAA